MKNQLEKMKKILINIKELSESLGVSDKTLYGWVHQKRIPFVKVGGLLRFDMKDIEKWIQKNKVQPSKWWVKSS